MPCKNSQIPVKNSFIKLLLLGTTGCHLCDDAEIIIAEALNKCKVQVEVEKIDIAEQEQWQEQYAVRIPVLYHPESRSELGWPFNQDTLNEFINELQQ
jgi:thiol-disulfide isomerase/thioredoxin